MSRKESCTRYYRFSVMMPSQIQTMQISVVSSHLTDQMSLRKKISIISTEFKKHPHTQTLPLFTRSLTDLKNIKLLRKSEYKKRPRR